MEITQSSKNPVEPPARTVEVGTSRRGGVATRPGMLQLRASGDASAVHHDFNKNTSCKKQRYKKRSRTKSDGSESLSDIDDSEIVGYLNNKKEMHLKRMLWEAMNKEHVKVKKQKPETKKTTSARKAVRTTEKLEQQKRSSRINYDALRLLNDDMDQGSGTANNIDLKLDSWRNDNSHNENATAPKMQRSEEGNYNEDEDEDQQQITCGEDDVMFGHHNDAMSYGYEDEYNENFDFED